MVSYLMGCLPLKSPLSVLINKHQGNFSIVHGTNNLHSAADLKAFALLKNSEVIKSLLPYTGCLLAISSHGSGV